ncbi:hypothetical protein NFI95_14630 [Acetobacteraceae bacterium KSS8]|uniref:Magnesium transporter MgtE intracellular domain-containing protein n=1 Tax=Endosaccharibacter trunci TaxID=2812733 RepID=A0ABT1WCZ4_9PROT|nr:hypothetical protein [Acetobacteraceae bacterium KSS8]
MARLSWQRVLLPATIAVMFVAFSERASTLAIAATESRMPAASAPVILPTMPTKSPDTKTPIVQATPTGADDTSGLGDLRRQREALDRRAAALDERAELLGAAEQKLQARLEQLSVLQERLEQTEQQRKARASANWNGLVKTYEAMKPEDAAAIFNVLDMDVLLEVLDRMDDRKEAAVLAAMLPERARQATQMLARKRLQENADAPSPVAQHG